LTPLHQLNPSEISFYFGDALVATLGHSIGTKILASDNQTYLNVNGPNETVGAAKTVTEVVAQQLNVWPQELTFWPQPTMLSRGRLDARPDVTIPYPDHSLKLITFTNVLPFVEFPEALVEAAIEKLLPANAKLAIFENASCESYTDARRLDAANASTTRPPYGYRSSAYWRKYLTERGFKVMYFSTVKSTSSYIMILEREV
jgi:hypothetical protein